MTATTVLCVLSGKGKPQIKQLEITETENRLDFLIEEAISFMHENFPKDQGFWQVAFSGGKDSIVLYDLVKKSGLPYRVHYVNTTIDPPELVKFIRKNYPEVKEIKAPPFFKMVRKRGFPLRSIRWCCQTQKKDPAPDRICLTGIRQDESAARKKRGRITHSKYGSYSPIFFLTDKEVRQYVEENNLELPSLYYEGFDRVGCVVCPFVMNGTAPLYQHMRRWPKHWKAMRRAFEDVWARKALTLPLYADYPYSMDEAWRRYINGRSIFDKKKDEAQMEMEYYENE